ncbi:MAG: GGDEF domain-containing protein [Alphaproteobacteria bacterium]|nr:GGDEF domain-containing protein [Alphaproteobacteria bacterium]
MSMGLAVGYTYLVFRVNGTEIVAKALVSTIIVPVFAGAPLYFMVFRRLRALADSNVALSVAADRDGLTACLNRSAFRRIADKVLTKDRRKGASGAGALLIIDVDHFKHVNDRFGHMRGDRALKLIADCVRQTVREGDSVGRIGGEEFAVLLRDADYRTAAIVAERIRKNVAEAKFFASGHRVELSVSVGGAVYEGQAAFHTLFEVADAKLYDAKHAGRDTVRIGNHVALATT